MASSKLAARAIRNHAKYKGRNDLNIVPMIDMMVILVFFLLFTAVFSNTNILELNLPAPNSSVPELPKGLQLEVIVRQNVIEIAVVKFLNSITERYSEPAAPQPAAPMAPRGPAPRPA